MYSQEISGGLLVEICPLQRFLYQDEFIVAQVDRVGIFNRQGGSLRGYREIVDAELVPFAQDDGPFGHVPQFPDIAGEIISP